MNYVLPCIGSSGVFTVSPPFDTIIRADESYKVKAIRTISELESNGIDVLKTRYLSNNLTELNYTEDLEVDMHIVTLQSGYGQWYEVPARYVLTFPRIDGVAYIRRNLVVQIPYIPKTSDLELLADEIREMSKDYVGVDVGVTQVEVSTTVVLSDEEHKLNQALRNTQKKTNPSLYTVKRELEQENQALRQKIALLEQYIILNAT